MNLGILEGREASGAISDTTLLEMLPGNPEAELPDLFSSCCIDLSSSIRQFLLFLFSTSFLLAVLYQTVVRQVHCSLLWPENYYLLNKSPKLKGLHNPGKLGQCKTAHFPGAYLGINAVQDIM